MKLDLVKILTLVPAAVQTVESVKDLFSSDNKEQQASDKLAAAKAIVLSGLTLAQVPHTQEIDAALSAAINAEVAALTAKDRLLAAIQAFKG